MIRKCFFLAPKDQKDVVRFIQWVMVASRHKCGHVKPAKRLQYMSIAFCDF